MIQIYSRATSIELKIQNLLFNAQKFIQKLFKIII
jgi:hypothetical protein